MVKEENGTPSPSRDPKLPWPGIRSAAAPALLSSVRVIGTPGSTTGPLMARPSWMTCNERP